MTIAEEIGNVATGHKACDVLPGKLLKTFGDVREELLQLHSSNNDLVSL